MRHKGERTVVTERGQTSIPAQLRKSTGLSKGDRLVWEQVSETEFRVTVLRQSRKKPNPRSMVGFLERNGLKGGRTDEYMREIRSGERET